MALTIEPHVAVSLIERVVDGGRERARDELAVEEPLEIRVDGTAITVTMRTPGEDEELAVGFLAGEALIAGPADIAGVGPTDDLAANVVDVRTRAGLLRDPAAERQFGLTSSCGICGKGALEHVRRQIAAPAATRATGQLTVEAVVRAPDAARRAQRSFARTGGLQATGLFSPDGELRILREDVGRHNAMDKALGALLLAGDPPAPGTFACLSGRVSFELVQKAVLAGLAGIVAVGAPTSLAVELAAEHDLLLCGFVRGETFNIYAGSGGLVAPVARGPRSRAQ